jgi:hypothetical protein
MPVLPIERITIAGTSYTEEDFKSSTFPGLSNPIIEFVNVTWEPPNTPIHKTTWCDGVHCAGKKKFIHGLCFKCIECNIVDFCETCVIDPKNEHDKTHSLVKLEPPGTCITCDPKTKASRQEGDAFTPPHLLLETTVSALRRTAMAKHCSLCEWTWRSFEKWPPEGRWPPEQEELRLRYMPARPNCINVTLLKDATSTSHTTGEMLIERSRVRDDEELSLDMIFLLRKLILVPAMVKMILTVKAWSHEILEADLQPLATGQNPSFRRVQHHSGCEESMSLARHWFDTCREKHPNCIGVEPTLPTRLIDVEADTNRVFLREHISSGNYAALTYCWGTGETGIITTADTIQAHREHGLLVVDLPPTLRDAVEIARQLGIRYLWVDRLCIIQDDDDWLREASRMCNVYENAEITISADHSSSIWTGIFNQQQYADIEFRNFEGLYISKRLDSHDTLQGRTGDSAEPLYRRAWTFQENIMSKRILHFTSNEMVWECNTREECECRRVSRDSQRIRPDQDFGDLKHMDPIYDQWRDLAQQYARRSLTYDSDKLSALVGLASRFRNIVQRFHGKADDCLAGLWKEDIARELGWMPPTPGDWEVWIRNNMGAETSVVIEEKSADNGGQVMTEFMRVSSIREKLNKLRRSQNVMLPSWSWVSMRGPMSYFEARPCFPFDGLVQIVESKMLHMGSPPASITQADCAITISGFVVQPMRVFAFIGGFGISNPGTTLMKEICYLDYGRKFLVQFIPDDPIALAARSTNDPDMTAVCVLLGMQKAAIGPSISLAFRGMPDPGTDVSMNDREELEISDLLEGLTLGEAPAGDAGKAEVKLTDEQLDDMYDSKWTGGGNTEIFPITWYLILTPSKTRPGSYERIGCFSVFAGIKNKTALKAMFRHATKQTITIV